MRKRLTKRCKNAAVAFERVRARILLILLCGDGQRSADRTKCDAWRKNSRTPAVCQRKECLTAAAGASNDAGASVQPRPPGAPCAPLTAHCAAPWSQRNAPDNPALPPLPAAPVAARGAPAESTSQRGAAPQQQTQASEGRTSSAPRLAAGRVQREKHRRPAQHRRDVPRPTSVKTQRAASKNARAGEARRKG